LQFFFKELLHSECEMSEIYILKVSSEHIQVVTWTLLDDDINLLVILFLKIAHVYKEQ
jgi:hypothetical protein